MESEKKARLDERSFYEEKEREKMQEETMIEIRPLTLEEHKYTYAQSNQLELQTGCIGRLRGYFTFLGDEFYTTWFDTMKEWKTDEFKIKLNDIINTLRKDKGLLHNCNDMHMFIRQFPESVFKESRSIEYGFRADRGRYAFLFRCNPTKGDYNVYCYCFIQEMLDKHIQKAEKGIRFINSKYKEMFRIPDGSSIVITSARGEKTEKICRYIDECHMEMGRNLFHICEFAELMERNGASYKPKQKEQTLQKELKHKNLERK